MHGGDDFGKVIIIFLIILFIVWLFMGGYAKSQNPQNKPYIRPYTDQSAPLETYGQTSTKN